MTRIEPLMGQNFIEYASYVIVDRAIPDIRDGLKPVQRRILATLAKMDDGKFHKVANVIGDTMKLHPHGDASIGDALVVLANKDYFIERQGNFGNPVTGHAAAAPRYIECRLTDLARETLFKKALTEYRPSYDGRNSEPVVLPAKLPVLLMLGAEGIAVGMATRILPHNFPELLDAQIRILKNEPIEIFPDFPTGGIVDVSEYEDGLGKVKVRARVEKKDEKTVVIREIAYSTTTESLIASIESAAQKGKVKIAAINDYTTDRVEIEIELSRGVYSDEVIPQLYAHTDCEVSLSANMVMIKDRRPVEMGVSEVLCYLTDQLRELIRAELQHELGELADRKHWLDLERIFIENRVYKRIEDATTAEQVVSEVRKGLKPFLKELDRELSDDDIDRLLKIPIRRISQYDIDRNRSEIEIAVKGMKEIKAKLRKLTATTITYLEGLLEKYGDSYPRRSEISTFEAVDVRAVARQNIKVAYDPDTGFFGSEVKGSKYHLTVSEYDRILLVSRDGSFRIIAPEDKVLIPAPVIHAQVFDPEQGAAFTVVYRDKDRIAWAKKVHIRAFIRDREYELVKDKEGRVDYLIPGDCNDTIHVDFAPAKRQRVHEAEFDLSVLDVTGVTARGRRVAPKPVSKLRRIRTDGGEDGSADDEPAPPKDPDDGELPF
ncbi:MAG TPA: DNA topoisomerase IV subunit A, partial [Chondromyces sp.]|nr:DNA topoisomerase IV subunit A [Chondromyces sp.]